MITKHERYLEVFLQIALSTIFQQIRTIKNWHYLMPVFAYSNFSFLESNL